MAVVLLLGIILPHGLAGGCVRFSHLPHVLTFAVQHCKGYTHTTQCKLWAHMQKRVAHGTAGVLGMHDVIKKRIKLHIVL